MPEEYGYEMMLDAGSLFEPNDRDLDRLAAFMIEPRERIPAGYTYLGQFIDHDVSFQLRRDGGMNDPFGTIFTKDIANARTPFLDLETIYGYEVRRPGKPATADLLAVDRQSLKLGRTLGVGSVKEEFDDLDLPRDQYGSAMIVDPRNDENLAVAQTQVLLMRFHNAVVKGLSGADGPGKFEEARKIVTQHYQWIVLHDYLPKILKKSVLADVLANGNRFYFPEKQAPYIPLEFSAAAFRVGHSMIANSYNWNRIFNRDPSNKVFHVATLADLMTFTGQGRLGGHTQLVSEWLINWTWFYEVSRNDQRQKLNLVESIDTKLGRLTMDTEEYDRTRSLAARDLYRPRAHGLPSGQAIAAAILGSDDRVLKPEQLSHLLPASLQAKFSTATPFWFYLLAEAEIEEGGFNLGEVGSRILAEVFVELVRLSPHSILEDGFKPIRDWSDSSDRFEMRNLLSFVSGRNEAQLNPLGP